MAFSNVNILTDFDLARELLHRLVERRGWTREQALEGIKERFPDLDIKLLDSKDSNSSSESQ